MKHFILLFLVYLFFNNCSGQENNCVPSEENIVIEKICDLPDEVHETSGILFYKGLLWTINDSGNKPELYAIDTNTGNLKHVIQLVNTENIDWEALTQDDDNIYIADNGNNNQSRPDYQLYIVSKDSLTDAYNQSFNASTIIYKFEEKDLESIGLSTELVNSEAILVSGDRFYVYIKDYNYEHLWVFSFSLNYEEEQTGVLCGDFASGYAITAATFAGEHCIAFLGYKDYHSFFTVLEAEPDLLNSPKVKYSFELEKLIGTQTEGITLVDGTYYISNEASIIKQALFRMHLCED